MLYDYIIFEKNDACFSLIHEKKKINNYWCAIFCNRIFQSKIPKNLKLKRARDEKMLWKIKKWYKIIYIKVKRVCSPSFLGLTKNANIAIFIHEKC